MHHVFAFPFRPTVEEFWWCLGQVGAGIAPMGLAHEKGAERPQGTKPLNG
jgi:hypothetical protein